MFFIHGPPVFSILARGAPRADRPRAALVAPAVGARRLRTDAAGVVPQRGSHQTKIGLTRGHQAAAHRAPTRNPDDRDSSAGPVPNTGDETMRRALAIAGGRGRIRTGEPLSCTEAALAASNSFALEKCR